MSTNANTNTNAESFDPNEIEAAAYGGPIDEADAYEIADVAGYDQSADRIEEENSFDEIPPGDWELYVVGFLKPPEKKTDTVYVAGRRMSFTAASVVVKLARVDAPGQQVTDYFLLPPDDPAALPAYFHGAKNPEGKSPGFMAKKFYHFMDRLGYHYPEGGSLPAEAKRLGNWKRRKIVGTVVPGKDYFDATTGETKPGRNQVKLFSYRPAGSPVGGEAKATPPQGSVPRRPGTPSGQQQMAAAGLDNI